VPATRGTAVHAVVTALEGWLECVAVLWRVGTDPGMQPVGGVEGASEVAMAMRCGRRKVECVPGLRFPSCRAPFPRAVRSCLPVVVAFFFAPALRSPAPPFAPAPRRICHFGPRPALAEPCARLHPTTSPWRHRHHVCPSRVRSSRSDGHWCAAS
jgi:hypothetical protein